MYITNTHPAVETKYIRLKASLTNMTNDWRIKIALTDWNYFYLTKAEAYRLASSLELALLELNDDEEQA